MKFYKTPRGFTLIELLIVVAIIAILAAIAIPNFLAAQIRAKVARAQGEMNSLATALESYRVDTSNYPTVYYDAGMTNLKIDWLQRLVPLTTPVAYISSVPIDPFSVQFGRPITYLYQAGYDLFGGQLPTFYWVNGGGTNPYAWLLNSNGPDQSFTWYNPYDPSNGTVSLGDIFRFGP